MPFNGKVGDSILIDDLGGGHRYVILSKPNSDGEVVIVNFTADKFGKDPSATFRRRDHKQLFSKPTVANYPQATRISLSVLETEAKKANSDHISCPANIVKIILIGAFQSDFTPTGILEELETQYPDMAKEYYKKPPEL